VSRIHCFSTEKFCRYAYLPINLVHCFVNKVHYALSNGAVNEVITELLRAQPNAARGVDNLGWTP
jgi:hypothetical protein